MVLRIVLYLLKRITPMIFKIYSSFLDAERPSKFSAMFAQVSVWICGVSPSLKEECRVSEHASSFLF